MINSGDPHSEAAIELMRVNATGMAEDLTGLPYNDPQVIGLSFFLLHELHDRRRAVLGELCDTYFDMSWQSFEDILGSSDFAVISREAVVAGQQLFTRVIAADEKRKLLLEADSHSWDGENHTLNSVRITGTVNGGETEESQHATWQALASIGSNNGAVGDTHFWFTTDCRDGLLTKIQMLDDAGVAFTDWLPGYYPSIDLVGWSRGVAGRDWHEKQRVAFSNLPNWVHTFINREEQDLDFKGYIGRMKKQQ